MFLSLPQKKHSKSNNLTRGSEMKNVLRFGWRSSVSILVLAFSLGIWAAPVSAQNELSSLISASSAANLLANGGFETMKPAYWEPTGAGATWSKEQFRTPSYSLKLSGAGTSSWAQNEAVRNWVGGIPGDGTPEIIVGGWVYTDGVNTNPADDASKFQLVFEFFDVPGGTNVLGAPVVIDVPQTAASSGWVELSSLSIGAISFPSAKAAKSVRITFRKGANATGSAYLEDIFIRNAGTTGWAGDWFNANGDAGDNWYYWWDGMAAGGAFPAAQSHFMTVSDAQAHSGVNSLRIEANGVNSNETPAISQRVPVTAGEPVLFSYWVKHENNADPTTIGTGQNNLGMSALWYENATGGAAGYGEVGGVDVTLAQDNNEHLIPRLVQTAAGGWKQYAVVAYPPANAVATEMRLRYYHAFSGATYWDDVFIAPVSALTGTGNLLANGGFETMKPAYWEPTGSGAIWSKEQSRTPGYSLKLSGAGTSSWAQNEAVRNWVGGIPGDGTPEIIVGGWVYTDGVNTNPADDASKFQLVFEFFDVPGGTNVLGAPVVIDVPQTAASSGWVELSSLSIGAISFPSAKAAKSVRITFRKGANATGSAYLEDIFIRNAGTTGWAGDWFNANGDAGDNWYYWWDGMAAGGAFPAAQSHFMTVSDAQAHSGVNSLRIEANGVNSNETPAISQRVPVTAGTPVLFSYWVKHENNASPTTIGTGQNQLGMSALWYENTTGGAAGFGEVGGVDVTLDQGNNEHLIPRLVQTASSGWKQYAVVAYPPANAVATEMRLRYYHAFSGVTYWDDVYIGALGGSALATSIDFELDGEELPETFVLHQNYPNPFNPVTTITFDLKDQSNVTLDVYNVLGQWVTSLVNGSSLVSGRHTVTFDASNYTSGVYLYALKVNGRMITQRMVLLK